MNTHHPKHLEFTDSSQAQRDSSTGILWKNITAVIAAIMISGCASPYQKRTDVVIIQNTPSNNHRLSVYEEERILRSALEKKQKIIAFDEEQQRLNERKARNARNTYEEQKRLDERKKRFYQEQGQVDSSTNK